MSNQLIECVVGNGENNEHVVWQVAVNSVVWYWWPHELELRVEQDTTIDFSIFPFNEESDSVECLWTIDGEELDWGNDIYIDFPDTGLHEVIAYVTEGAEADTIRWGVEVYDPMGTADLADGADLPAEPTLYAPAPNPFNGVVNFKVFLPQAGDVSVVVYDVKGRVMIECCDGVLMKGVHNFAWNGQEFAAGLYLVVLQAGGERQVRKMVLVK